MSRDLIESGLGWSWTRERVLRHIRDPDSVAVTAVHGVSITGFAIMTFTLDEAHLKLLAVRPGHRRRGVGTGLVRWLEETALVAGTPIVYLELRESNRAALDFYRKLGYRTVKRIPRYYRGTETALLMGRDLWYAETAAPT